MTQNIRSLGSKSDQLSIVYIKCKSKSLNLFNILNSVLFSIFCGLLVGICLLATIMEILKASNNLDNKAQAVENSGHISMDKDANEKTLLLPDATTKVTKDEGINMTICVLIFAGKFCFSNIHFFS